ncbi:hypothetical protein HF086_012316 [Spodoptera exigua]|uniref:PiggyBac transposable element-derived protein domain-containing protein n=1 Tax=Spodoptera exigua TaxID=7107 RepID=A0A922MU14_SPOEX|nr:hypothetical protein HF086_012316 [Spodoptera exigua]
MASKRKKLAPSNRPSLFAAEDDADESHHDPYSDVDCEFGSDTNYDPDGVQESESSESDYEIFSTRNLRRMPSSRISESPVQSRESSLSEDDSIPDQQLRDKSSNSPSVVDNSKDGVIGFQESESFCQQTNQNTTTLLNQILETVNDPLPTTAASDDPEWVDIVADIPDFNFDQTLPGLRVHTNQDANEKDIFDLVFTPNLMEYLVTCTNAYGNSLVNQNRPHTRHSRHKVFHETNVEEMFRFLGLSLLSGQIRIPENRKLFTHADPLYYHPMFSYVMSGRRYEQILRCLCASKPNARARQNKWIHKYIDSQFP